jgi:hypothetical protein
MYFNHNKSSEQNQGFYDRNNYQYLKYGIVESIYDEDGLGRIKVRIKGTQSVGGDDGLDTDALPWSFPLIPKHLATIPKVGEVVWLFVLGPDKQHADRLYMGPVISQLDKLNEDLFVNGTSPLTPFTFGGKGPKKPVTSRQTTDIVIPEIVGVFPKPDEISIQGRYNTDITQKKNEVVIRAGKFEATTTNEFKIKFNYKTQGLIQIKNEVSYPEQTMKNGVSIPKENGKLEVGSVINVVSNKINLLTHKDGTPTLTLNNENLISDEEVRKMLETSHQLPFGDILLEYLRLLKDAVLNHVHNGNGNPSTDLATSGNIQSIGALKAKAQDLESKMLSKNIRIN